MSSGRGRWLVLPARCIRDWQPELTPAGGQCSARPAPRCAWFAPVAILLVVARPVVRSLQPGSSCRRGRVEHRQPSSCSGWRRAARLARGLAPPKTIEPPSRRTTSGTPRRRRSTRLRRRATATGSFAPVVPRFLRPRFAVALVLVTGIRQTAWMPWATDDGALLSLVGSF